MSFRDFLSADSNDGLLGTNSGARQSAEHERLKTSLAAEAKRTAVLVGVAASGINALQYEPIDIIPRYLTRHLPSPPVVFPVAAIIDCPLPASTLKALRDMYRAVDEASRLLNALVTRGDQGMLTKRTELERLVDAWSKACDSAIEALEALKSAGVRAEEDTSELMRMLIAARVGGCPCLQEGRAVMPQWAQLRRHRRFLVNEYGTLVADGRTHRILVADASKGGVGISGLNVPVKNRKVVIRMHSGREIAGAVAWQKDGRAGVTFATELAENDPLICFGFD